MGKIKIKKSELDRIIKEEALKFKKALTLKKELSNVEKQLKQLNEVEAGEKEEPTGGGNLTAAETQFVKDKFQHKAKFHNPEKNPNTMMEDDEDIEDTDLDVDVDTDVDADVDADSDTIDKTAVLKAIEDLKMALNLHGVSDESEEGEESEEDETNGEEVGDEDTEFEFDADDNEGGEDIEDDEVGEEAEEEVDELNPSKDNPQGEYTVTKENLDEPIEGGSPIQKADGDDVNDNMKKVNNIKAAGDTLMESEKRRMAVLAGIMKG
jgi:hypothetical protein